MAFSPLARMLLTERHRQRAATMGGFASPAIQERKIEEGAMPLLVTNARGGFVEFPRLTREGCARYGFSLIPVSQEDVLLGVLYRAVSELSTRHGWLNRCRGVPEAVDRLRSAGLEPRSLIIPESMLPVVMDPGYDLTAVRRLATLRGFVGVVDGMQVMLSNLPEGAAIVAAGAPHVGIYTRVGDHLGLLLQRVNRIMVIARDLA